MIKCHRFSNATFGVCLAAFLTFGLLYEWCGWYERTNVEASRIEALAAEARMKNDQLEKWNAEVARKWALIGGDPKQSEALMAELMERR